MNNLIDTLNFKTILGEHNFDITSNFEAIYPKLNLECQKVIEESVHSYFSKLTATHYDRLLLSLRSKDAIITFNWDPFLFDAYSRNKDIFNLPDIIFLHGNVRIGACIKSHGWGPKNKRCKHCKRIFKDVPLLYPEKVKSYTNNLYTISKWEKVKKLLSEAFTLTIFGYGAPASDKNARPFSNRRYQMVKQFVS